MDHFPAEAELVHGSRMEVFHKYITFLDEACQDILAVGGGCVEGKRFLVGVELKEVVARAVGIKLQFVAGRVACAGTFDLDYIRAKPREELST